MARLHFPVAKRPLAACDKLAWKYYRSFALERTLRRECQRREHESWCALESPIGPHSATGQPGRNNNMARIMRIVGMLLATFFSLNALALATDDEGWTQTDREDLHRYEVHGQTVFGHMFGFITKDHHCDEDIVWIEWSTLAGSVRLRQKDVDVELTVDGVAGTISLDMVTSSEIGNRKVFALTNFVAGDKLLSLLEHGKMLKVTLVGPVALVEQLDIPEDTFTLRDFSVRRNASHAVCKA